MPRTSCGAPMAFGCSRWTTAGAGSSPPSSIGTPRCLWHVCKRGDRFAALQPISMGLAGRWLDRGRRGSGAGLADGSRLPVSVGPLHQPDQVLGHPAVLRLRRRAPDQRRRRAVQSHAEGQIIHGRINRNIAELRDAVRDFVELYNAQWIVEKNGYLSPAQARQAWHAAISIRPAA